MNILDEIAGRTRERIAEEQKSVPLDEIRAQAEEAHRRGTAFADGGPAQEAFAFEKALRPAGNEQSGSASQIAFICEVKKASPSKGLIAPDFPYLQIAMEYEKAGAAAISCLTEPHYFLGQDAYLREIVQHVQIPVLRKDFTVDEYMIYQARAFGAGAVLLICSILDDAQLKVYGQLAQELGLSALVEAHTEEEVTRAMRADAKILGVNNRDLKTFQVDLGTSARYRCMVPPETIFVSESGVRNADDIRRLVENGTNAVLIGETLMRAPDKAAMLKQLRSRL
ncbi:MAG: indole-3-glycerol phosphate synthase TrpC [Clostridiales bacterium]|nr:indole-3-glycerol phosphate synthase TrpC [Clostridiales bacterium]